MKTKRKQYYIMRVKLPSITLLSLDLKQTFNLTLYENIHFINAYNVYYTENILDQGGIFTNTLKYNIRNISYIPSQSIGYEEIKMFLEMNSPFIDTIETIYNNSEDQMLKLQKKYNKTLDLNEITDIIYQEQKKVLDVNNETILYNKVLNEHNKSMGYIENIIELKEYHPFCF